VTAKNTANTEYGANPTVRTIPIMNTLIRFLVVVAFVAACNSATPTPSPAPPTASPSPAPSATPDATTSPSAAAGIYGRVVFDRYINGAEGMYEGTYVLESAVETKLDVPFPAVERRAVWSPGGQTLLIDSWSWDTGGSVGIFDLTAGTYTPIEHGLVGDIHCTDWSLDGLRVICSLTSENPDDDGLYSVSVSDGTVTRLTHSQYHFVEGTSGACGGGQGRAVYSPSGAQIAYEEQRCGAGADPSLDEQGAIVVADADGSNPTTVVDFGGVRTHPGGEIAWSPSSDLIAFATQDGLLSVIHSNGLGLREITLPVSGFVFGPAWAPDGSSLLVSVNQGSGAQLYVVSADGSSAVRVTDPPEGTDDLYTDWGVSP
jgi:hypothetical protein